MSKRKRIQQEAIAEDEPAAKKQRLIKFENATVPALLDVFPGEIVERILSNLSVPDLVRCGTICKYFFETSKSVSLWRHLLVKTSLDSLKSFGSRAWSIIRLILDDVPERKDLARLAKLCPNLMHLDLVCSNLSEKDLSDLLLFPDLRVLNLETCKFTDAGLIAISTLPSLRSLTMLYSTKITEAALNQFILNAKTLKHLSITYFTNVHANWKTEAAKKFPHITFEDDDDNDTDFVLNENEDADSDHEIEGDSENSEDDVFYREHGYDMEYQHSGDEFAEEDDDSSEASSSDEDDEDQISLYSDSDDSN